MKKEEIISILKSELIPASGCTEPSSCALCGAKAREILGKKPSIIEIYASRDIVKNAMGVSMPGVEEKGICAAVSLGVAIADSSKMLSILENISEEEKKEASLYKTQLEIVKDVPPLYIKVVLKNNEDYAVVVISSAHDRYSYIEKNEDVLLSLPLSIENKTQSLECLSNLTISDVLNFVESIKVEEVPFIETAIDTNFDISLLGMKESFGLEVGKTMLSFINSPPLSLREAFILASSYASSGSDARMSGSKHSVIINSGSGNQGITVTVPVKVVGDYLKKSREEIIRAVCLSELMGLILTSKKDRLSALCGAYTASIATSAAYTYLLGGREKEIEGAINIMVGDMAGIICDGAKSTCALKIYSSLEAASLASLLSIKGHYPGKECGIVGSRSFESIEALSRLSHDGMEETDKTILDIMVKKNC